MKFEEATNMGQQQGALVERGARKTIADIFYLIANRATLETSSIKAIPAELAQAEAN